jgi:glycosyltransferase involved in cell wall biosynthesis
VSLPLSAIVVSRNEAAALGRCLPTIRFCAEILVVDLESDDETAEVARANGARVLRRPPVPSVERARAGVVADAAHDWLLFTDPDEELPVALAEELATVLPTLAPDVAVVYAPCRYHFGARALRGTVWGGVKERKLLVRRSGAEIAPTIFAGATPREGFRTHSLPYRGDNAIVHRWVGGYRDFLRKHRRYVRLEGEDRFRNAEVTGYRAVLATPWRSFYGSFVRSRGFRDGLTGLALSALWAFYRTGAELALMRRLRAGAP